MAEQRRTRTPDFARPRPNALAPTAAFGPNPGALDMLSYVPEGLSLGAPLVVVLHGCGQTSGGYASDAGWLALADRLGFVVLAPQQTSANNPNRCFNWFSTTDIHRGEGEAASIAAMIAFLVRRERLDPRRVFITGLSAGGAMTMAMLATYPDLFAAGAVIAGLPYGVANGMMQAMTAMQQGDHRSAAEMAKLIPPNFERYPRLTVWHGGGDLVVSPENAEAIALQWAAVQGLPMRPDETIQETGRSRRVWRGPTSGEAAIELNIIAGMGHGVPLSTRGADGVGKTAPYMLEAGVSSSEEIAAFWGLAAPTRGRRAETFSAAAAPKAEPAQPARWEFPAAARIPASGVGDRVIAAVRDRVPTGVQDVITTALKQAGLLK